MTTPPLTNREALPQPAQGDLRKLRGILKAPPDRQLSLDELDEVICRAALAR